MTSSQKKPTIRNTSLAPASYPRDKEYELELTQRQYSNQFFHIYSKRLNDLRPRVYKYASEKWDHKKISGVQVRPVHKVLDIRSNRPCWIIGLTFCEMQYKPNVLDEVKVGAYGVPPENKSTYRDPDSDAMMLEDESGRVKLAGELIENSIFVTGNVIGVLGIEKEAGVFNVLDVLYPAVAEQVERPLSSGGSNNKIAFVSGLNIDPKTYDPTRMELLSAYLGGEIGSDTQIISRLVIAGNLTHTTAYTHDSDENKYYGTKSVTRYNSQAMQILDAWLYDLVHTIPVDFLPGSSDPAEVIFPQQPLHKTFFKKCKQLLVNKDMNLRALTNPSWLEIDGVRLLGTGGQNVNDLFKYLVPFYKLDKNELSQEENCRLHFDLVEATIEWQNIVPNCPDTLWTYPFKDSDPFTLDESPHVYFVGNQPSFESKRLKLTTESGKNIEVLLISVPEFSKTGQVVLLDTSTLQTEVVTLQ